MSEEMVKLSKTQRAELYAMFNGCCAYCGCTLPEKGWHADHVEPVMRKTELVRVDEPGRTYKYVQTGEFWNPENNRLDNYMPSCRACNIDKGCNSLEGWRSFMENRPYGLRRDSAAFRHAERFGLVAQVESKVVFHFEKNCPAPQK